MDQPLALAIFGVERSTRRPRQVVQVIAGSPPLPACTAVDPALTHVLVARDVPVRFDVKYRRETSPFYKMLRRFFSTHYFLAAFTQKPP